MLFSSVNILPSLLALSLLAGDCLAAPSCKVQPTGGDDHDVIVKAFKDCADGGTIRFPAGNTYTLASPISDDEYPALSNTQIIIEGNIHYVYDNPGESDSSDIVYWKISGKKVDISGSGVIKGGGTIWWKNKKHGPKLMELDITRGTMSDITLQNGPSHMMVVGGSDFVIDGVTIHSISDDYNDAYPANTDGMNINGQRITIQNVDIVGGDDCISFLNKADTVHVNNVKCGGPTHGISVGTLGSTDGKEDGTVQNILVENVSFYDGGVEDKNFQAPQFLARIKTYNNTGSHGTVSNVTWQHIRSKQGISSSGKTAVYITQNHNSGREQEPGHSSIKITDVTFSDIHGGDIPNADKYGSVDITCSADHHCDDMLIEDIVFSGDHSSDMHCKNVGGLDDSCE